MAKKLIISEKQLRVITQHINESDKALNEILTEGIIEEGFKEIALSLLMLAGVGLSGQNQAIAQDALSNQEIVQKVDAVLTDTVQLNKLVDRIDKKMPGAAELIQKNADQIKATINYIDAKNAKKKKVTQNTQTYNTMSPSNVRSKLRQGYAVTDIKIKRDTILPKASIVTVQDTIDYKWSSDNFFQTGTFQLNQDASDSISTVVADINAAGGTVIGVYIESSTDTEPIRMGNAKLASLRANSVQSFMQSLDLGDATFNVTTKPDNGPKIYKAGMSSGERAEARVKTAEYRYVNVRLIVVFDEEVVEGETAPQVIERHIYELTRVYQHSNKTTKIHYKWGKKNKTSCKKIKVKKNKGGVSTTPCEMFGGGLNWAQ